MRAACCASLTNVREHLACIASGFQIVSDCHREVTRIGVSRIMTAAGNNDFLTVLSIDDDLAWQCRIRNVAILAGWTIHTVATLADAQREPTARPVDIILLYRMLAKGTEGLNLVDWLKTLEAPMPGIIVLSYLSAIDQQVMGLDRG